MDVVLLIAGLIVLVASGEVLVRGAAGIALKASIPPLIVGLTVVSIGTSAPELFASVTAALEGNPGLSVGNVIGSNIANLALVLGITAIIYPIPVSKGILWFDGPIMMFVSILFVLFAWNLQLEKWEGGVLLVLMVAFIVMLIIRSRRAKRREMIGDQASANVDEELDGEMEDLAGFQKKSYLYLVVFVVAGCVGLYFGSDWFVSGASGIADYFGVSDHIIGVTVVAFGTSVPELVASIIAAFRRQTDISIGNLVGSNIFNVLSVLGFTSLVTDLPVNPEMLETEVWWMLGVALIIFPMIRMGYKIVRYEGFILLGIYIAYITVALT